jgi:hypothetical protein
MTSMNWERIARATGIGFVVMFIAAFIVYGEPPKVNDSGEDIASTLREAGKGGWAATTIAAGAVFVGLQAVTGAIAGGLALNIAAAGDDGILVGLNTVLSTVDVISAYALALFIFAATIGLTRAGLVAGWYGWLGLVAGALVLLHGTNWSTSGFWSPTGGYLWVTIIAGLGWIVVTSVLLYLRTTAGERSLETAATA